MDRQTILDTPTAANATVLSSAEASAIFRSNLKSSINVPVNLNHARKNLHKDIFPFPVVLTGGKTVTNNHPVLVALRDVVRDVYQREFGIMNTAESTLIIIKSR